MFVTITSWTPHPIHDYIQIKIRECSLSLSLSQQTTYAYKYFVSKIKIGYYYIYMYIHICVYCTVCKQFVSVLVSMCKFYFIWIFAQQ